MGLILPLLRVVPIWVWLAAALVAWGAWNQHEAKVKGAAAAQATAALAAEKQARADEAKFAENARRAADVYQQNLATANRSAAATRSALDGLRNALPTAIAAAASAGAASSADGAVRAINVVGECAGALTTMATEFDICAVKLSGLQGYIKAVP